MTAMTLSRNLSLDPCHCSLSHTPSLYAWHCSLSRPHSLCACQCSFTHILSRNACPCSLMCTQSLYACHQATVYPWICYVSMNLLWQQSYANTIQSRTHNIFMNAQQSNGDTTNLPTHTGWSTWVTLACLGYPVSVSNKNLTLDKSDGDAIKSRRYGRVSETQLNQHRSLL